MPLSRDEQDDQDLDRTIRAIKASEIPVVGALLESLLEVKFKAIDAIRNTKLDLTPLQSVLLVIATAAAVSEAVVSWMTFLK